MQLVPYLIKREPYLIKRDLVTMFDEFSNAATDCLGQVIKRLQKGDAIRKAQVPYTIYQRAEN